MCDRPSVRLGPGEMVWARVNIHDLDRDLEPGEYPVYCRVWGCRQHARGTSATCHRLVF